MARVQFGTELARQGAKEAASHYIPAPSLSYRPKSLIHILRKLFLRNAASSDEIANKLDPRALKDKIGDIPVSMGLPQRAWDIWDVVGKRNHEPTK